VLRAAALALATLVVIGLAASLILRLYGRQRLAAAQAEFQRQGHSLDLASYELPGVPKEENAAAWLEAGAAAIVWSAEDEKLVFGSSIVRIEEWDATRIDRLRAIVGDAQGALQTLHRGDALPRASFEIPYREGPTARLFDLRALRRASTLMLTEGRLALYDRDGEGTVRSMAGLSRLADALVGEPIVVGQLMGDVADTHAVTLAAEAVRDPAPWIADGPWLGSLAERLPLDDRLARWRRAFAYEGAALSAWLARAGFDDPSAEGGDPGARLSFNLAGLSSLAGAGALEAAIHQTALVDTPLPVLLADQTKSRSSPLQIHRWWAESLTRAARRSAFNARFTLAQRQLVRASLVLRAMGTAARAYPAGRPPQAGLDQPDALTAMPLRYEIAADGSARVEIPGVSIDQVKIARRHPAFLAVDLPSWKGRAQPIER
jgi:hypothetical protein